ncbi:transposase, partial [Salmonella enterica]|nr:transposase [Salmonella enterica]
MYVVAKELVGLPGMPATEKGIREALQRLSKGLDDCFRRREGTKAIEYHINCLPKAAQEIVLERHFKKLMEETVSPGEVKAPKKRRVDTDSVEATEAYRGSPGVMRERLDALTENQRQVANARALLVAEVWLLESEGGLSRIKAINYVVSKAKKGELPAHLQEAAVMANAKRGSNRTISRDPLYQWVLKCGKAQNAGERLLLLAPGKRPEVMVTEISWMSDFMAHYRQSNGRPITEAYGDFVAEWQRRHADEPHMLEVVPSYDTVLRAMRKLPEVVKQKGRITGSEYRQLEGFTRRDWSKMPVNYVWIGDGHGMKMKCAHPIHGRPFSPEVTFVIDGGTRFVVGWSLDLAENVFAVAGAIQHGIRNHGKPFIYYSDNGSGETADVLDKEVVGILPRLGINHPTG